jgi:hypothetical protein
MTLLSALQTLFTTNVSAAPSAPACNWQAPPPMVNDALGGQRAGTVRRIACATPEFLPRPTHCIER